MKFDPLNDGISSVELVDYMGSDLTVVNAARVSMHKESEWEFDDPNCFCNGTGCELCDVKLSDKDAKLINYLARHNHWTPFSHPQITLRIKMPIFLARQWFKHQVGLTRNEVSRRYVSDTPEFFIPTEWRKAAENVKQGSSDEVHPFLTFITGNGPQSARGEATRCLRLYETMIAEGICPEQARMVLPQSMYTEFIETGSLAAYARVAGLRLDGHAQKEVQWYAQAIDSILGVLYPVSWEALREGR